jgi:hypothetical protein
MGELEAAADASGSASEFDSRLTEDGSSASGRSGEEAVDNGDRCASSGVASSISVASSTGTGSRRAYAGAGLPTPVPEEVLACLVMASRLANRLSWVNPDAAGC